MHTEMERTGEDTDFAGTETTRNENPCVLVGLKRRINNSPLHFRCIPLPLQFQPRSIGKTSQYLSSVQQKNHSCMLRVWNIHNAYR